MATKRQMQKTIDRIRDELYTEQTRNSVLRTENSLWKRQYHEILDAAREDIDKLTKENRELRRAVDAAEGRARAVHRSRARMSAKLNRAEEQIERLVNTYASDDRTLRDVKRNYDKEIVEVWTHDNEMWRLDNKRTICVI